MTAPRYDWSKLSEGWTYGEDAPRGLDDLPTPYIEGPYEGTHKRFYFQESYGMTPFGLLAVQQLRRCMVGGES